MVVPEATSGADGRISSGSGRYEVALLHESRRHDNEVEMETELSAKGTKNDQIISL